MSKKQGKRAAGARAGLRGPKVATKATKGAAGRRGKGVVGRKEAQKPDKKGTGTGGGQDSSISGLKKKTGKLPRALDAAVTKLVKERATRPAKAGTTIPRDGGRKPEVQAGVPASLGPEVPLEDGQWETFCLLMSQQRFSAKSCYAQVFPGSSEDAARTSASRLLTNANIRARIEWLRKEAVKAFTCDKEELMRFLHAVVFTPVGHVDEESPLAQEVQWEEMQAGGSQGKLRRGDADSGNEEASEPVTILKRKVKMPGKKECGELLARMQGWEKPKEVLLNMAYEPPSKALQRAQEKGVDVMGILKKAGILGG